MKVHRYFDFKSILSHYIRPGSKSIHRTTEKWITYSENIFSQVPIRNKLQIKKNYTDITKLKYLTHFSSNLFEMHANNWNHSSPHKNPLKLDIRLF